MHYEVKALLIKINLSLQIGLLFWRPYIWINQYYHDAHEDCLQLKHHQHHTVIYLFEVSPTKSK